MHHLYSDGNYFPRAKKSGFGGYIEDPSGIVLLEYTEQIKQSEYAHSFELLGIIRGLQIAKNKGIENITSHCDDKNTAVKLKEIFEDGIFKVTQAAKPELYREIIELSKFFKSVKFEYIPRAQNKYADSLSRRYAALMEDNFLKHYDNELNNAENKLAQKGKLPKRMFFSHPNLIRNPNKNNPFLVAQHRNKKVRKVSRLEQQKDYKYLFIETFIEEDKTIYRSFIYDKNYNLEECKEKVFDNSPNQIDSFCNIFSENLKEINNERLWIYSNHRAINVFFEQKEKIPNDYSDSFHQVFNDMEKFKGIFYHHLPFKHLFSPEIASKEIKKEKLSENIDNVDVLMEQLSLGILGKEQNKCFGNLIRHHFRSYQERLQRELEETEKSEIIERTTQELKQLGYKNLPLVKK